MAPSKTPTSPSEPPRTFTPRAHGSARRGAWVAGLVFAGGALAAATAGCSSLSKPELEARLLELGKNAPAAAVGLTRKATPVTLDGEVVADEIVYLYAPRAADAPDDTLPVVLIHGTPSTLFAWTDLIFGGADFEGLRAERDVYAIEIAGHGIAPGDAGPYTFERCARFAGEVVKSLGLERFHVAGSSYGGEFAWRLALNEPDRVASVVLLDASGYARRDEDWLSEEEVMRENSLAGLGWMLNSRERIESALAPHFREIPPDRVEEFFLVCENKHNWGAMIDLARDENGTRQDDLRGMRAPTLVLWGADDVAYPPEVYAQRFADDVPDAELVVLEGTGHYPHEERPADVIRAMNRFFAAREDPR